MAIREQIKQLELEREQIKADLFDARAEQAEQVRKWNVEGVSTPLEQRLDLQAEIADLEAHRQSTKVELMKMKQRLKESNEKTYRQIVGKVLVDSFGEEAEHILEAINSQYEKECV